MPVSAVRRRFFKTTGFDVLTEPVAARVPGLTGRTGLSGLVFKTLNATLEVDEFDEHITGVISLECNDSLVVRFNPSQCHVHKKLPQELRQSKAKREMVKAVEKLKCRDALGAIAPHRRVPKAAQAHLEGRVEIPRPWIEHPETVVS